MPNSVPPIADHSQQQPSIVSMRSSKGMAGLLLAEVGASMVELDVVAGLSGGGSSGFKDGARIEPGFVTPMPPHGAKILPPSASIESRHSRQTASRDSSVSSASSSALGYIDVEAEISNSRTHRHKHSTSTSQDHHGDNFARSDTLLHMYASPARKATELTRLLGGTSAKSEKKMSAPLPTLEQNQGKRRSLVSLDLVLENNIFVEGGYLSGSVQIRVGRPSSSSKDSEKTVLLGGGKIRVAGFEVVVFGSKPLRHIFYQVSSPLSDVATDSSYVDIFSARSMSSILEEDEMNEGFAEVREGKYTIPFAMPLPIVTTAGKPKGILQNIGNMSGVLIRYIAIASLRVIHPDTGKRSIAHFYRDCEVWPRFEISKMLFSDTSNSDTCISASATAKKSRSLLSGGGSSSATGELRLTAMLSRPAWVAGQLCHVRVHIDNGSNANHVNEKEKTKKKRGSVKSVRLVLVRTVRVFKPRPVLDALGGADGDSIGGGDLGVDPDACETETVERKVGEEVLCAGQKGFGGDGGVQGYASAKGWWTGVAPGESGVVVHSICIPSDALTIIRARLLEVEYTLKVSLGVGSSLTGGGTDAVTVSLPVRIINFLSLDPPPPPPSSGAPTPTPSAHHHATRPLDAELDTPKASQSASAFSSLHHHYQGDDGSTRRRKSAAKEKGRENEVRGRSCIPSSSSSSSSKARKLKVKMTKTSATTNTATSIGITSYARARGGLPKPSGSVPLILLAALDAQSKGQVQTPKAESNSNSKSTSANDTPKSSSPSPSLPLPPPPKSSAISSKSAEVVKPHHHHHHPHSHSKTTTQIPSARTGSKDMGALEDEAELQDVLFLGGEIPGSVSLLEEQYASIYGVSGDFGGDFGGEGDSGAMWEDVSCEIPSSSDSRLRSGSGAGAGRKVGVREASNARKVQKLAKKAPKLASTKNNRESIGGKEKGGSHPGPLPCPPSMQVVGDMDGDFDEDEIERIVGRASEQAHVFPSSISVWDASLPLDRNNDSFSSSTSMMRESESQTMDNASFASSLSADHSQEHEEDSRYDTFGGRGGTNGNAVAAAEDVVRGLLLYDEGKVSGGGAKKKGGRDLKRLDIVAAVGATNVAPDHQVIAKDPGSPHKHTFSERVQVKMKTAITAPANSSSAPKKTRVEPPTTTNSWPKTKDSAIHSVKSHSVDAPPPPPPSSSSTSPIKIEDQHERPTMQMERSKTTSTPTPSSSVKGISASESSSKPGVAGAFASSTSVKRLGNGLGGVRARIAMLEEQAHHAHFS